MLVNQMDYKKNWNLWNTNYGTFHSVIQPDVELEHTNIESMEPTVKKMENPESGKLKYI